jgi:hypothetical protein
MAFEKLVAFMKDLGNEATNASDNSLQELLHVLALENNSSNEKGPISGSNEEEEEKPLSEEDLLKKPFYTVAEPSVSSAD